MNRPDQALRRVRLMPLTLLVVSIYVLVLGGVFALAMASLWCGLKLVRAPTFTWRRLALACLLVQVIGIVVVVGEKFLPEGRPTQNLALSLVMTFVAWVLMLELLSRMFRISYLKSLAAWIPSFVASFVTMAFLVFVFVPFGIEAFVLSGNSLAPTLRGLHHVVTCPACGGPAIARMPDLKFPGDYDPVDTICLKFHVYTNLPAPNTAPLSADHVLSVKFLRPGRWEIATFRYPEDPQRAYISRIVGLPGETVFLAEGAVWVNGEKLTPPPELSGLRYDDELDGRPIHISRKSPAKLGPDEYFVLGDFSINANDSRIWTRGAPGHPAFAVPEDYITGRVTHIYWPPSRWRTL